MLLKIEILRNNKFVFILNSTFLFEIISWRNIIIDDIFIMKIVLFKFLKKYLY